MKKFTKRFLSTLMAAVVTVSGMSAAAVSAYAEENNSALDYSVSDDEMTIVVDVSKATPVYVDTSNMDVVDLRPNARSVSLPYSNSITFDGTMRYAYTPVFEIEAKSGTFRQLTLTCSNFTGPGKVDAIIYFHQIGDPTNYYRMTNLGVLDYNIFVKVHVVLDGTAVYSTDLAYLVFYENASCATKFDYEVTL